MIASTHVQRVRLLAGFAIMALFAAMLSLTNPPAATATDGLEIADVSAPDDKSIEITFDRGLDEGLQQYVAANINAVRPFIRVSGGVTGDSDETLDGSDFQTVGAEVFPVDTPGENTLRIVLPSSTTLSPGRSYELWFDGDGATLAERRIRAADGTALGGTETAKFQFDGPDTPASAATVESVEPLTSRLLRVTFVSSILSGMPNHDYSTSPSRITIEGAPSGVRPVYIQQIAGSDSRVYDIYLNDDLKPGESYTLRILGNPASDQAGSALRTTAGTVAPNEPLAGDTSFTGTQTTHSVGIESVDVGPGRTQLTVRFEHKVRELAALPTWMPGEDGNRPVLETPVTGTTGDSLTATELATILTITGRLTPGKADPPASGNPDAPPAVGLNDALRHTAAYFADRQTLVISLAEGNRLRRGSTGTVTLQPHSIIDVAGTSNGPATQTVEFTAPDAAPPPRSGNFDPKEDDYLTVDTAATVTFTHYDFTFADGTTPPNYRVNASDVSDRVIDEEIDAIVVENKYIKATFTPEYGARLLSMIYKPTGNDLLYANPVGTPYGHGDNSPFYANWLMVWGGIAPTFSEPEHGKYWFLPWDYEIVKDEDRVSITMSKVDNINHRHDGRFSYGATGLELEVTYTVYRDKSYVDLDVAIHNPGDEAKEYEYWTLTTLAPGTPLHEGSPTMEFVTPLEKIRRDPAYTWMADIEERVNPDAPPNSEAGRELYFDNMRYFSRWLTGDQTGGIAYGLDLADNPQGDWWGVVNHENSEGAIRVAPNDVTPGMKFWTWGFGRSFDTNPYAKGHSARPYVEPWGGVSDRFFSPDVLEPGETKAWTETFLPTVGLHDVTNANKHGAAHVQFADDGTVEGFVFPTDLRRNSVFQAQLVDVGTGKVIATKTFRNTAYAATELTGDASSADAVRLVLRRLSDKGPEVLLTAQSSR